MRILEGKLPTHLLAQGLSASELRTAQYLALRGDLDVEVAVERLVDRLGGSQRSGDLAERLQVWLTSRCGR